ncbi:MAG: hypothetical protein K0U63_02260 [Cyanobacteria bacterium]|nr:hypothetical protein [Cyanobacteriota bacterium]
MGKLQQEGIKAAVAKDLRKPKSQQDRRWQQIEIQKVRIEAGMTTAEDGTQQGRGIALFAQLRQQGQGGCDILRSKDLPEPSERGWRFHPAHRLLRGYSNAARRLAWLAICHVSLGLTTTDAPTLERAAGTG